MQAKWSFNGVEPAGVRIPGFPDGFFQAVVHKVEDQKPESEGESPKGFWVTLRPHPSTGLNITGHEARIYGGYDPAKAYPYQVTMSIMLSAFREQGWTAEKLQANAAFDFDPVTGIKPGTIFYIQSAPQSRDYVDVKDGKTKKSDVTNVFHDVAEWQKRKIEYDAAKAANGTPATAAGVGLPQGQVTVAAQGAVQQAAAAGIPGMTATAPAMGMPGMTTTPAANGPGVATAAPGGGLGGLPGLPTL